MIRPLLVLFLLAVAAGCAPRTVAPTDPWGARFPDADTVRVEELAPGVSHAYLWLAEGPWAIQVVEVDEDRCRAVVAAVHAGPPIEALAPTSVLAGDAIVAINADFFMSPGGTPVGAHVRAGRVLVGPGSRPIYALDAAMRHRAGTGVLAGFVHVRADSVPIAQVNRPADSGPHHPQRPGIALFDEWYGKRSPSDPPTALVRLLPADPDHPGRGRGLVESLHPGGRGVSLDSTLVALQPRGADATAWLGRRAVGDTVAWRVDVRVGIGGEPAREALGVFPLLVEDGRGIYAEQTGVIARFGPVRHPRTAIGWDEHHNRVLWVVVDGRQPGYSEGMTLPELERLFLDLGATHAVNFDGGGSTTLVVRGRVANRPSDSAGERAVANALLLEACR